MGIVAPFFRLPRARTLICRDLLDRSKGIHVSILLYKSIFERVGEQCPR